MNIKYLFLLGLISFGQAFSQTKTIEEVKKAITGSQKFTIDAPRKGGIIVNAADFGLKEHGNPEKNVIAIKKAIAFCKKNKAYKLTIPKGRYELQSISFKPTIDSLAYVLAVKRNPPVVRIIALEGMKDFILDGQGAEFIVKDSSLISMGAMVYVADCERVRVENLTIDWDWEQTPIAALGYISAINKEQQYLDWFVPNLRMPAKTKLCRESGTTSKDWNPISNMRNPEVKKFVLAENSPGYGQLNSENVKVDSVLNEHCLRTYMVGVSQIEKAKLGQCANLMFHTNFDPYGVEANNNDHLVFHNLNIYTALNHRGFTADYNKYLEISSVKIIPRPGTARSKSSHGTFEIHNSRGFFLFENNVVDSEMDDFMHISDGFVAGKIQIKDKKTMLCERIQYYSARYTLRKGVTIEFMNEKFEKTGQTGKIASVQWLSDYYPAKDKQHAALVTFENDLPEGLTEKTALWNKDLGSGNYIIRNNKGTTLACRGILTSWPNGTIENNRFENAGYSGILLDATDVFGARWFHGPNPSNIIIRNNIFNGMNKVLRNKADIEITERKNPGQYYNRLLIENNTIQNSESEAHILLANTDGIIVRGNTFTNVKNPNSYSENFGVKIVDCTNFFISK